MAQILIVEDEVALVDVIKAVLTAKGHTVLQAYDGQTGADIALRERPALVIADHMLPLKTGLELCHDLKAAKVEPSMHLLLMTAGNVPVDDRCPDAVLRKPFAIEEFENTVDMLLPAPAEPYFG